MKKILFLMSPHASLNRKSFATDNVIDIGPSEVLGGLEHFNYPVDCYDLNAKLFKQLESSDQYLSLEDIKILTDVDSLSKFLVNPDHNSLIYIWAKKIIEDIDLSNYDVFAISLSRRYPEMSIITMTLHFTIILTMFFPKKVILGGNHLSYIRGINYIKKVVELPGTNIKTYFIGDGRENFHKFLQLYEDNITCKSIVKYSDDINFEIRPSFDINNIEELTYSPSQLFSKPIIKKYEIENNNFAIGSYKFSKGCPFDCAFCQTSRSLKFLEYNKVVDNLEYWVDKGINDFQFINRNINFHQKYLFSLCDEIVKRNLKIRWSDSANLLLGSEEIYSALGAAGCIKLWYGAETFSPKLLKIINKNNQIEKTIRFIQLAHKNGIWNCLNLIVNFPYETKEDLSHTLQFLQENKEYIDTISVNCFLLLPNSPYHSFPGSYGITAYDANTQIGDFAFNKWYENNGLRDWDEIGQRGKEYLEEVFKIMPKQLNEHMSNDWYLHTLRRKYDKLKTKEIMIEMIK